MRRLVSRTAARVALLAAATPLATGTATAHVDYVVDAEETTLAAALQFLVETLTTPLNAVLLAAGAVGVLGTLAAWHVREPVPRDVAVFRETMAAYTDLVPWLLRISVGLPLVGAGFAGYYFTPAVPADARLLLVGLGFLLLFGLATRAAAVVALGAYLVGLALDPRLLLASEFVGGFVAIALVGAGRPAADHVLQRVAAAEGTVYGRVDPVHRVAERFQAAVADAEPYLPTVLRASLGVNFVYLGLAQKLLSPAAALAVVEKYRLAAVVPVDPALWVVGAGLTEIAVGLALLLGLYTRGVAVVAFALFTTTLFGLADDPVLAHLSLYGLVSVLLITGSGPLALDGWLARRAGAD